MKTNIVSCVDDFLNKVPIESLTPNGKTCRHRAIVEMERRYFGNTTNERIEGGAVLVFRKRELAITLIDLRTVGCQHLTKDQTIEAREELESVYVAFFKNISHLNGAKRQLQRRGSVPLRL